MHFIALWLSLALPAQDLGFLERYQHRRIATGPLFYHGWGAGAVRWAEGFLPETKARIEAKLGRRLERPFTTVLVDSYADLRQIVERLGGSAPDPYTQGVALPGHRMIVVRGDLLRETSLDDPRAVTLTHEVAHLVLHRGPGTQIPRWLDEGVAVWVSQRQLSMQDEAQLSLLARTGSLYSLQSLEKRFPEVHNLTTVAYMQSYLMVLFLETQYGSEAIVELLDLLERGTPIREALQVVTGLGLEDLEGDFVLWTAGRHSLLFSLLAVVNIWTVAALLALLAIARHIVRRRRLLRRMEAADGGEIAPGPPLGGSGSETGPGDVV